MSSDLIQIVDCLSETEVSKCLTLLEGVSWGPTTIFGEKEDGDLIDTNIRKNQRYCPDDQEEIAVIIHEAMNKSLLLYKDEIENNVSAEFGKFPVPGAYRTNSYREGIQVLSYTEDEFYNWHHDQASDPDIREYHRTISVILYLQNAEEGGRTIFTHRAYRPKAGQALIFPSNWCYPHYGEAVTKGRKIAAVTWYDCYYNYD